MTNACTHCHFSRSDNSATQLYMMVVSVNKSLQCSVVGDGFVGKSCLVERFLGGEFNSEYVATLQDDYIAKCNVNGDSLEMNITDFAGEVG